MKLCEIDRLFQPVQSNIIRLISPTTNNKEDKQKHCLFVTTFPRIGSDLYWIDIK